MSAVPNILRTAVVDGPYRYTLGRQWGADTLPICLWILSNPSKADAQADDPTADRAMEMSRRCGFGGYVFANLFAWRATKPKELREAFLRGEDIVGPNNDATIGVLAAFIPYVICAWGVGAGERLIKPRSLAVRRILAACGREPAILKLTSSGEPWHPLYLPNDSKLEMWR